jgi:hypothetical protein
MSLRNAALQSWARYFFRLLYMLPVYCAIRAAWDWKKLSHASDPWSEAAGIVIQGVFFTLFYSLLVRDRTS